MKLARIVTLFFAVSPFGLASANEEIHGRIEKVYADKVGLLAGSIIFRLTSKPKDARGSLLNIRWFCEDSKPSVGTKWKLQVKIDGEGRTVAFECALDASQ